MSYIRQSLMPGERVVDQAIMHWGIFITPVMFIVAGILVPVFFSLIGADYTISLCCGGIVLIPGVVMLLMSAGTFLATEFAVTDKRLIGKKGIFNHRSVELPLTKIESVDIRQSFSGRILNYGSIVIRGSGGTPQPFHGIEDPQTFRQRINAAMAAAQ